MHTNAAPTWPLSERDPSVDRIQTSAPILTSFHVAQCCTPFSVAVVSSCIEVPTPDSSPWGSHFMHSVVQLCSCYSFTTLHLGSPNGRLWSNSCSLLLCESATLTANNGSLELRITRAGVTSDSLTSALCGVVVSTRRMVLACGFRRSWRSSRLPRSLGSYQISPPDNPTACSHATWMPLTLSRTTTYVVVMV